MIVPTVFWLFIRDTRRSSPDGTRASKCWRWDIFVSGRTESKKSELSHETAHTVVGMTEEVPNAVKRPYWYVLSERFDWDLYRSHREEWSVRMHRFRISSNTFKGVTSLDADEWQFTVDILDRCDVSAINYLELVLPHHGMDLLGPVLGSGRFSKLKALTLSNDPDTSAIRGLGQEESGRIAAALRIGQFTKLENLFLPACDVGPILRALTEGNISQLKVFSIKALYGFDKNSHCSLSQELDAGCKRGCFKSLQELDLANGVFDEPDAWDVFTRAVKSGKLPNITRLCLSQNALGYVNLARLVPLLLLNSFQSLTMDGCWIKSEQVCDIVDTIMAGPHIRLVLRDLDLHDNYLNGEAIDALVYLANSDRLPKLQVLNLSMNQGLRLRSFVSLMETIQRGHLPSLERLVWEKNPDSDAVAEAIARAYFEEESLTAEFDIDWNSVSDLSLRTKVKEYRDRNVRLIALKTKHNEDLRDDVPLKCARVFLCGYPLVGKTTLRKTLTQSHGSKWTEMIRRRRPTIFPEGRTRGIELSSLVAKDLDVKLPRRNSANQLEKEGKNMELVLWDLAGQEDFHVLHGTFLADLGFAGGRATTFVIVFKSTFEKGVDRKLRYWLRFVASSSQKFVNRHVVIVLNCFKKCTVTEKMQWIGLIKEFEQMFSDLLDISLDPFIVNARVATSIQPLKNHLIDHAQRLLQHVTVPRLCLDLQEELRAFQKREEDNHLPILSWEAFETALKLKPEGHQFTGKALKAAALYLHEIGRIIYFDNKKSTQQGSERRSVVVPDPEWFCSRVVGELLIPKEMSDRGCYSIVEADGSIRISRFQVFFENLLDQDTRTDDVISMLEQVGLCFKKGINEIVAPALIQQDDFEIFDWEGKGFHRVMGRCLATEDHERSAIPMTLFRHLQVELAHDENFGGRGDSDYRAGKSFSSLKVGGLWVMVQFDVNHLEPTDERIDILVKSMIRGDPTDASLAQATCICKIMQKLEKLCVTCCPGLTYDIKVIKPWSATEKTPDMIERALISLREIESLIVKKEKYSSWLLNGSPVELKTFLSESELNKVMTIKTTVSDPTDDSVVLSKAVEGTDEPDFWSEMFEPPEDQDVSIDVVDVSENPYLSLETEEPDELDFVSKLAALTCSDPPIVALKQLDEMVYEVYTPAHLDVPELEVVFFHGLQLKYGSETYVATWMARDDSQLWLQTWLVQECPGIRILIVSYDASADTQGLMDVYLIAENLLGSLTSNPVNFGQSGRPIVLVGHCLGGLVMKEFCLMASKPQGRFNQDLTSRRENLIASLRGMFFYGTPHCGSEIFDLLHKYVRTEGPLVHELETLNNYCTRRNWEFENLRTRHRWLAFGVGESKPTYLEFLGKSIHVVPDASARFSMDVLRTDDGDHFDVCKPADCRSSSFRFFVNFLSQIRDAEVERES